MQILWLLIREDKKNKLNSILISFKRYAFSRFVRSCLFFTHSLSSLLNNAQELTFIVPNTIECILFPLHFEIILFHVFCNCAKFYSPNLKKQQIITFFSTFLTAVLIRDYVNFLITSLFWSVFNSIKRCWRLLTSLKINQNKRNILATSSQVWKLSCAGV